MDENKRMLEGVVISDSMDKTIVVKVEAYLRCRPTRFSRHEPHENYIVRFVNRREHMSPASLISNTLELARSHPLLLLHVREAEERKASLVRKRQHSVAEYSKWKRARHRKTRDDNDDREPDEPTDGGSRSKYYCCIGVSVDTQPTAIKSEVVAQPVVKKEPAGDQSMS